jgi:hypothetical protein
MQTENNSNSALYRRSEPRIAYILFKIFIRVDLLDSVSRHADNVYYY